MCKRKKDPAKCCNIVNLVFSIINLLLLIACFVFIALKFPAKCDLDFDYYGVIVGILSLLVTVLIGWNIYSAVDIKKSFSDLKRITEDKSKELSHEIEQRHYYTEGKSGVNMMNVFIHLKTTLPNIKNDAGESIIDFYIIYYGLTCAVNSQMSERYDYTKEVIKEIIANVKDFDNIIREEQSKQELLRLLGKIDAIKYPESNALWAKIMNIKVI